MTCILCADRGLGRPDLAGAKADAKVPPAQGPAERTYSYWDSSGEQVLAVTCCIVPDGSVQSNAIDSLARPISISSYPLGTSLFPPILPCVSEGGIHHAPQRSSALTCLLGPWAAALILPPSQGPFTLQHLRKLCAAEIVEPSTVIYSAVTGSQRLDKLLAGDSVTPNMGTVPSATDGALHPFVCVSDCSMMTAGTSHVLWFSL